MSTLSGFKRFTDELKEQEEYMPVLFVGHGSPMNAIEDNEFSRRWKKMAGEIPVPKAVLIVSAHWLTRGTHVTAMEHPKTIHDFGGFPEALFDVEYPAPGSPAVAAETAKLITSTNVGMDHDWGLDHGAWSVVRQMYPDANIPMIQLSIDYYKEPQYHYDLAKQLQALRKKGVLILASGNMVHNLGMMALPGGDFNRINEEYGFDWAHEMNTIFKEKIGNGDHRALIEYEKLSKSAKLAIPTPDHYYPLLYVLALQRKNESATFFNDKALAGSLTMTSVKIT
ncbi:MAG: 4,5-DOPA dioxygenase extradiol [Chitinophagales bacterium]|nr:4,5-DOPA dioxygenase extradiol [Chitinophagales bacterium]